ncbi:MAG: hypothetical protein MSF04_04170 [Bacilli bacterium]|nr:hypothetical protein [Bacilli bacterium]
MKRLNALLVFLISSLAITGVSFIDGKIWDVIFIVVGMVAYAIVGVLFSIGVLHGKEAGKEAYAFVFFLLILAGYGVYKGLEKLRLWILAWPLTIKIIVPIMIALLIGALITLIIMKRKRNNAD